MQIHCNVFFIFNVNLTVAYKNLIKVNWKYLQYSTKYPTNIRHHLQFLQGHVEDFQCLIFDLKDFKSVKLFMEFGTVSHTFGPR